MTGVWRRGVALCVAASSAGAGAWLACHHPWQPVVVATAFGLWAVMAWRLPDAWLFVVPALLPVMNFSPWTGWIGVEEFDLLMLGAIAGGHLRTALLPPTGAPPALPVMSPWAPVFALGFALFSATSAWRGWIDAGAGQLDWFQAYTEPLNSVRLLKPVVYLLAVWPMTRRAFADPRRPPLPRIAAGMMTGLFIVSLVALWERATYPGLLEFAARYRTTALFWEMHVGGGAIDFYLALATPFAAWALYCADGALRWYAAAALALLAAHACLTTFSRGVYLGVGLPLLWLGGWLTARRLGFASRRWLLRLTAVGVGGVVTAGLLALAFAERGDDGLGLAAFAGISLLCGLAWRSSGLARRRLASAALAFALVAEVVLVLNPESFMRERVATGERDFGSRLGHWRHGLALLRTPADLMFGIGLGRLPTHYAASIPDREFSGAVDARTVDAAGVRGAVLHGPPTMAVLEGLYGLTQRVPIGEGGPYRVRLRAQAAQPAALDIAVCEMHLLYARACQMAQIRIDAKPPAWQTVDLVPQGHRLSAAAVLVPREGVFWLSAAAAGSKIVVDDVRLTARSGSDLLVNGRFGDGLAHWLPVATGYFVPWHIDNLWLEILIERGVPGLACFLGLIACAVRGGLAGIDERSADLPFFAASLGGALVVGAVSSLMDVPRVSFLLMWWLTIFCVRPSTTNR